MLRKNIYFLLGLLFLVVISGCSSPSIEKEKEIIHETLEETLTSNPKLPNKKIAGLSFYLPASMRIKQEQPYNLLIAEGQQTYILFSNPNEKADSEILYEMSEKTEYLVMKETYREAGKFGYVVIYEVADDLYEVTIGIGGVKMTTETNTRYVAEKAKEMMEIVASVQLK